MNTFFKIFLSVFIGTLCTGAFLGMYILLFGTSIGEIEEKILFTTLSLGFHSILGLSIASVSQKKDLKTFAFFGIGCVMLSFSLTFLMVWSDIHFSKFLVKSEVSAIILSVACAHASLILLPALSHSLVIFIRYITLGCIAVVSLGIIFLILSEFDGDIESIVRILGALGILGVLGTLLIPLVHFLTKYTPSKTIA